MSSGLALLASYSDEESEEEKSQTVERVIKLRVCDIWPLLPFE